MFVVFAGLLEIGLDILGRAAFPLRRLRVVPRLVSRLQDDLQIVGTAAERRRQIGLGPGQTVADAVTVAGQQGLRPVWTGRHQVVDHLIGQILPLGLREGLLFGVEQLRLVAIDVGQDAGDLHVARIQLARPLQRLTHLGGVLASGH